MVTNIRVRGLIFAEPGSIILIKRIRPGSEAYWVTPGGGIEEADKSYEDALRREIWEELGAHVDIQSLLHMIERQTDDQCITKELFYSCALIDMDAHVRTGPEFSDPSRGEYIIETIPFTHHSLDQLNIKPVALKEFLLSYTRDWSQEGHSKKV